MKTMKLMDVAHAARNWGSCGLLGVLHKVARDYGQHPQIARSGRLERYRRQQAS